MAVRGAGHRLSRRQGGRDVLARCARQSVDGTGAAAADRQYHRRRAQHGWMADRGGAAAASPERAIGGAGAAERDPCRAGHRCGRVPAADGGDRHAEASAHGTSVAR